MKKLAVVYATKGGMGDVGKFAAALAATDTSVEARIVSLSRDSVEGSDNGLTDVDVTDASLRDKLAADLHDVPITHADVDDAAATAQALEAAFDGADAVVACVGSRQPTFGRWVARGSELVTAAMAKRGVRRLVILSSMGIGDDFMPNRGIRMLWGVMLATMFRGTRNDLINMETVVTGCDVDYLLVRPVGLTPAEPPKDVWKVLTEKGDHEVDINVAKKDVARFMVKEALNPTLVRTAVTLASPPKTQNDS